MKSTRSAQALALSVVLAVTVAACDGGEEAVLTTTTVVLTDGDDSPEPTTTTVTATEESTTVVPRGQFVDGWEVVGRESDDQGETLYFVIPPGAYTDVDLENFILDLYEEGFATYGAEVFDDATAVNAYLKPESDRTEAEQELVDRHHFVSLVNGAVIRFQGPFALTGELIIGS